MGSRTIFLLIVGLFISSFAFGKLCPRPYPSSTSVVGSEVKTYLCYKAGGKMVIMNQSVISGIEKLNFCFFTPSGAGIVIGIKGETERLLNACPGGITIEYVW